MRATQTSSFGPPSIQIACSQMVQCQPRIQSARVVVAIFVAYVPLLARSVITFDQMEPEFEPDRHTT